MEPKVTHTPDFPPDPESVVDELVEIVLSGAEDRLELAGTG